MGDLIERLKSKWAKEIKLRPGVSSFDLDAFQRRDQVVLPPAFRAYFATVDGTGPSMVSGDWCFRFWPIDEVVPISEYCWQKPGSDETADGWILFADHLIDSMYYAIKLTRDAGDGGSVSILNGIE